MLTMAGRITLGKSSLSSIPSHVMQYIKLPSKITDAINRVQRDFIWGTTTEKRKLHLLNWDTIASTRDKGGLGVQKNEIRNRAILVILAWRVIQNPNNLWNKVLVSKYHRSRAASTTKRIVSRIWNNVHKGWQDYTNATRWVVKKGNKVSFFHDTWIPHCKAIRNIIHGPIAREEKNLKVKDLYHNENWDLSSKVVNPP